MPKRKAKKDDEEEYDPEVEDSIKKEAVEVDDDDDEGVANGEAADLAEENAGEPDSDGSKPKRKKKLRRKINYEDPTIDILPSYERKTKAGGYAHTNKSKEKISMANRGNTPWNKGRVRSSADKAKIKAGVQARNRAIKLEKLRRLGMTEEEFDKKKKEIKYLRERVRRTKLANDRHAATQAQKKLQDAIDATTDNKVQVKELVKKIHEKADEEVVKSQKEIKVFTEEITWTPAEVWKEGDSYDKICPTGGPGGLICCQGCAKKYSTFIEETTKDLEVQRTHKLGNEVKEIVALLDQGRSDLERIGTVARRKPPPTVRRLVQREESRATTSAQKSRTSVADKPRLEEEDQEWNLTSTFDIVQPMGINGVWGV